jgi:hypothetical protein
VSRRAQFETIRTEGGLLPADLLQRVRGRDKDLGGLRREDYGLPPNEPLNEAIVRSYNRLVGAWGSFREAQARLPEGDPGTTVTRDRWLLVLLQELGYGRVQTATAVEIEGKSYAVSHSWQSVPIHLVGCRVPIGTRTRGVAGAATKSPHATLQELLNRSDEQLWGIVSNGLQLRVLRDNSSLTRQAYLEFDLEQMMDGDVYPDFALLWMVCHASRVEGERPHECWLERWSQEAVKQGTRALEGLRKGVEAAISALGSGFLTPGSNAELKDALRSGEVSTQDYYRQLLRLVYRLLFLFVAEDRGLLHHPDAPEEARERYARWYSTRRLRDLAEKRRGTKHGDLWEGLKLVMGSLGSEEGSPPLGLPPLGSFLWSTDAIAHLDEAQLPNRALLEAVRSLATMRDGRVLRSVDYKNLGAEELGSVYESLLELHPELDGAAGTFMLTTAAGHERKTTGSYYTPTSLINVLLDSALDPVLDEAAAKGEEAILDLKVCDPACGSGHFLVAAAHRIAKRLASVRTGEEEPAPEEVRRALRDVVSRCLYGVDLNPMAVELCKVSLWLEALDPGRPLSFLDAHIKQGNSLLGTTSELLSSGLPDDAFKPLEGDDKEIAKSLKSQNRREREGQLSLDDAVVDLAGALQDEVAALEAADDATLAGLHLKEQRFRELAESESYKRAKLAADAWCAAFVQRKEPGTPRITTAVVRRLATGRGEVSVEARHEIRRLAREYAFFQWGVEFPQVFGRPDAGFDCVLANPPWERVKLQEKEFFGGHREIAGARSAAVRKRLIAALEEDDPPLYSSWIAALRRSDGESHLLRSSGRYALTGRGDVNTYAVFAELMRSLIGRRGRVGCIVPTGIATDATTQFFFRDLGESRSLASLYDFENRASLFPAIDSRMRFCLLTLVGPRQAPESTFVTFAHGVENVHEPDRRYVLSPDDFALLNPNTHTLPTFRTNRDAELTKAIYRRVPVFVREGESDENPWGVSFMAMFHMANDSHLFHAAPTPGRVPLYEGKMVWLYDHRAADVVISDTAVVRQGQSASLSIEDHENPERTARPRFFVDARETDARLTDWEAGWLLGWRDVTSVTNERTVVAAAIPRAAVGDKFLLMFPERGSATALLAMLSSYVFDYCARQKLGGTALKYFVMRQLPVLPPELFTERCPWEPERTVDDWIRQRVVELVYTSWDMEPFASDHGLVREPFAWNPERRSLITSELDAAFFHLYGLHRDEVEYALDTFPIVRRKEERALGEYRTKRMILGAYDLIDEIARPAAITSGRELLPRDALKPRG